MRYKTSFSFTDHKHFKIENFRNDATAFLFIDGKIYFIPVFKNIILIACRKCYANQYFYNLLITLLITLLMCQIIFSIKLIQSMQFCMDSFKLFINIFVLVIKLLIEKYRYDSKLEFFVCEVCEDPIRYLFLK
jgi:hypothetical protein